MIPLKEWQAQMDEPSIISKPITLEIKPKREGYYTITSNEIPGLYLAGPDLSDILADVPNVVEALALINETGKMCDKQSEKIEGIIK